MQKQPTSANRIRARRLAAVAGILITGFGLTVCIVMFSSALKRAYEIRFAPAANTAPVNVRSQE